MEVKVYKASNEYYIELEKSEVLIKLPYNFYRAYPIKCVVEKYGDDIKMITYTRAYDFYEDEFFDIIQEEYITRKTPGLYNLLVEEF
jgi:hypothetical protein